MSNTPGLTGRIFVRPLSVDDKESRIPKELIVDYISGKLYISNVNGEMIDALMTPADEVVTEFIKQITADPSMLSSIYIELSDGRRISLKNIGEFSSYASEHWPTEIRETIEVSVDDWVFDSSIDAYRKIQTWDVMSKSVNPNVNIIIPDDYSIAIEHLSSFNNLYKITTEDGSFEMLSTEIPTVAITLQFSWQEYKLSPLGELVEAIQTIQTEEV